jgi:high-affinity Fe2+/Pb2+ permease
MFVFGDPAPRPLQWWAPWVHTVVFGAIAGVLTYGTVTWGAPRDRAGTSEEMWIVLVMLWVIAALALGRAVFVTIRRLKRGWMSPAFAITDEPSRTSR